MLYPHQRTYQVRRPRPKVYRNHSTDSRLSVNIILAQKHTSTSLGNFSRVDENDTFVLSLTCDSHFRDYPYLQHNVYSGRYHDHSVGQLRGYIKRSTYFPIFWCIGYHDGDAHAGISKGNIRSI